MKLTKEAFERQEGRLHVGAGVFLIATDAKRNDSLVIVVLVS